MSSNITIIGNTGKDVELRYTPTGTPVANFSVASNSVRNTANGRQKKTDWYNVSAFGRQAETLAKYLEKGDQILIHGKLTFNPWIARDGSAQVSADVTLQDFCFTSAPAGGAAKPAANDESENAEIIDYTGIRDLTVEPDEEAEMLAAVHAMDETAQNFAGQY